MAIVLTIFAGCIKSVFKIEIGGWKHHFNEEPHHSRYIPFLLNQTSRNLRSGAIT
jgi:hypothetical protein